MQYQIVQRNEPDDLSQAVEALLNEGWELHGPLLFINNCLYTQALTNEQDPAEPPPMDSREALRTLAELLNVREDQLPPNTKETRAEIAKLLQATLTEDEAKNSETDSE